MKIEDHEFEVDDLVIRFYYDSKTHRWRVLAGGKEVEFTEARGDAIIDFLEWLQEIEE